MKKMISRDLEALGELVQEHHKALGLDPVEAMKSTAELVKSIGEAFHRDTLYITYQ